MSDMQKSDNNIDDYLAFHDAIDEFVWLIRLMYAPKEDIKRKHYRVDELFQYFIRQNSFDKSHMPKGIFGDKASTERFSYYLRQGLYNELAASYPFNTGQYHIGTTLNGAKATWKGELFPSWLIVQRYYSVYTLYNSLLLRMVTITIR